MSPTNSNPSSLTSLQRPLPNAKAVNGSLPLHNLPRSPLAFYDRSHSWKVANNLLTSFRYAGEGVGYAFKTQRNFRVHTVIGIVAISLSVFLQLSSIKIAVIGLTIGAVMAMELLNTAIEAIVDLSVGQAYHDLAKIAKDCAAGAVLIFALTAVLVAVVLILPPLMIQVQALL
ncbi:MAG: diacylglycerol kinase family protein [Microcoleaceae cyanobacterium]